MLDGGLVIDRDDISREIATSTKIIADTNEKLSNEIRYVLVWFAVGILTVFIDIAGVA